MNLLAAHNGEDREMDVVSDGEACHRPCCDRAAEMTASLQRAIQRDPNPNGRWKGATLSNDGTSLVTDRDGHTYILTVREVTE